MMRSTPTTIASTSLVCPPAPVVRLARFGTAASAAMLAGLAAQVVWVAHRRLPVLVGVDVSGTVPGAAGTSVVRLVAMGDSTLTGPGVDHPREVWLRRALDQIQPERSVEVFSLAVGGSRLADVAGRVDEALALEPDIVVLAVGSNDAFRALPPRSIAERLDGLVVRLLAEVAVVAVANVGEFGNVARVPPPLKGALRRSSRGACRAIERVVDSHDRAVLIDVTSSNAVFRDRSMFAADLFHPTAAGHSAWADAAVPGLQDAFDLLSRIEPDQRTEPTSGWRSVRIGRASSAADEFQRAASAALTM